MSQTSSGFEGGLVGPKQTTATTAAQNPAAKVTNNKTAKATSGGGNSARKKVPSSVANGRYDITKKLGAGCFGEVYKGVDRETKEEVAVKFEDASTSAALQLEHEALMLHHLRHPKGVQGFATLHHFGKESQYNCMVMEFLGKSLEDRVQSCKGRFTSKTTCLVADQIIRRIEYVHSRGIVHRDIKPENFMWGVGTKQHHLYLIDFGLSKKYFEKKHVVLRQKLSLTGTARYASVNAHKGVEQSRRDDLEAIGHMLMYFLRGSLPWSGLDAKTKSEKYKKIMEKKESTPLTELCVGFPDAFRIYLNYCRNLGFKERPDYNMLCKLFRDLRQDMAQREGPIEDHDLDWNAGRDLGDLVPLHFSTDTKQPDEKETRPHRKVFCCCGGGAEAE